ncbi:MAG: molybdopterin molybdotransferase MoeA, partial [Firmicutes bacterium]|nr:molybdopterin molybdotransferase MoeA [Bacillota bacterium]
MCSRRPSRGSDPDLKRRPRAFGPLPTPAEARSRYLAALALGPRGTETIPIVEALGRVLAEDVVAAIDLPPFDRSAVDGWAVRAADTTTAAPDLPVRLRIAGEVGMGAVPAVDLAAGTAVRVATGGMLPTGADAVVMQEDVSEEDGHIAVRGAARAGGNVIPRGLDVRAGEVVLARGRRLRPADLGLLAGEGLTDVAVYLPPRVAILATGDEVVPPDVPLGPGQVHDMNSAALAGAVRAAGGLPTVLGIVPDERGAVEDALRRALAGH